MGQKVHPIGFRLGVTRTWESRWYARKEYAQLLHEDLKLRKHLKKKLANAGISKIEIERAADKVKVNVHTARPGIVIGKKGAAADTIKDDLARRSSKKVLLNIIEVKNPEGDANLIAQNVAGQLAKRVAFRRAMKKAMTAAFKAGVKGMRIAVSGRLGGADIARREWYSEDSVPLHTLRANIDYGTAESHTTYGIIGVRAWVYHGDTVPLKKQGLPQPTQGTPA